MLEVKNLVKIYKTSKNDIVKALDDVSISFPENGLVFLLGKSGSGKSTLLNTIGGLDKFDSGEIIVKGKSSKQFSQSDFDSYRNTFIGFIFQEYNILEEFTVQKNIALAIELQGKKATKENVDELLRQVEMEKFAKRKPNQLSGGQKQRIAIARALIKNPEIIMADEPTGALDSKTGEQVMQTLKNLSKTKLVIIVSHDQDFAERYGDRIIELKDGKVIRDITKKEVAPQKTKSGISIIDDKIVHIKKGQEITKADLDAICKSIVNHSKNGDTIISLDEKANEDIKKSQFITDDGNREVFKPTEKGDVKLKEYNGKDLKLIRSHLKFKDSFKMGASALKSKVGKLIFTILLSFVAFAIFGVVDTFSAFNRADSVYETIKANDEQTIAMRKETKSSDFEKFTLEEVNKLSEKFSKFEFDGAIMASEDNYNSYGNNISVGLSDNTQIYSTNNNSTSIYQNRFSGITDINNDKLNRLGFSLLAGSFPQNEEGYIQVCITKHIFDSLKKNSHSNLMSDYNTFLANITYVSFSNTSLTLDYNLKIKIVGIIDPKIDMTKYDFEANEKSIKGQINSTTITTILSAGYANMLFTTIETKEQLRLSDIKLEKRFDYYNENKELGESYLDLYDFESCFEKNFAGYSKSSFADLIEYFKDGVIFDGENFTNLNDDEVIVSTDTLYTNNGPMSFSEFKELAEQGKLFIKMQNSNNAKKYKVVGFLNYRLREVAIISSNTYKNEILPIAQGYGFIATKLTHSDNDNEKLISYCEKFRNGYKFTIQNSATPILDDFGETITDVAQIFFYVGLGFAVFAALLLMSFIATSISYKRREIGILRALGARGSDVFGIFFNESLIIAFINFVLATIATAVISTVINWSIMNKLGIHATILVFGVRQILLILGVSLLTVFIASLLPVMKIARKKPIDAINNR